MFLGFPVLGVLFASLRHCVIASLRFKQLKFHDFPAFTVLFACFAPLRFTLFGFWALSACAAMKAEAVDNGSGVGYVPSAQ